MKKSSPLPQDVIAALKKIALLSTRLPEPHEFYKGRSPEHPSSLPDNILCFVRREAILLDRDCVFRVGKQHHRFVMIFAMEGSGYANVESQTYGLQPGEFLLVFPFQFHSYYAVQPKKICWIYLTFELGTWEALKDLRSAPSRRLDEVDLMLLQELIKGWTRDAPANLLQLLLATLLQRSLRPHAEGTRRPAPVREQTDLDLLAAVNRHVLGNLDRTIGIKELASRVGRSESYLCKSFRAATGLSLGRHLRSLRLRRASVLLQGSSASIGEIAETCGFESIYAFSRAFKCAYGLAPSKFREAR